MSRSNRLQSDGLVNFVALPSPPTPPLANTCLCHGSENRIVYCGCACLALVGCNHSSYINSQSRGPAPPPPFSKKRLSHGNETRTVYYDSMRLFRPNRLQSFGLVYLVALDLPPPPLPLRHAQALALKLI